jgi:hypothetical protein
MKAPRSDIYGGHLREGFAKAQDALDRLQAAGITVLRVEIGDRRPVIRVQNSARLDSLYGVTYRREPSPLGPVLTKAAILEDCQVQWTVRGH